MNADAAAHLQRKIHQAIPLSRAMGYRITELADTRIAVAAPLGPNSNIHGTGFAGSVYALGILAAWALGDHIIRCADGKADLVVAEAAIDYLAPVRGDIVCHCSAANDAVADFVDGLSETGRSRIALEVSIGEGPAAVIRAVMHARRV